jgi:hypothetical protein
MIGCDSLTFLGNEPRRHNLQSQYEGKECQCDKRLKTGVACSQLLKRRLNHAQLRK